MNGLLGEVAGIIGSGCLQVLADNVSFSPRIFFYTSGSAKANSQPNPNILLYLAENSSMSRKEAMKVTETSRFAEN